jgi:hypothetical protein
VRMGVRLGLDSGEAWVGCVGDVSHVQRSSYNKIVFLPLGAPLDPFVFTDPLPLAADSGSQEGHILIDGRRVEGEGRRVCGVELKSYERENWRGVSKTASICIHSMGGMSQLALSGFVERKMTLLSFCGEF